MVGGASDPRYPPNSAMSASTPGLLLSNFPNNASEGLLGVCCASVGIAKSPTARTACMQYLGIRVRLADWPILVGGSMKSMLSHENSILARPAWLDKPATSFVGTAKCVLCHTR